MLKKGAMCYRCSRGSVFARDSQVAGNQCTGRFFTDEDIVADWKVLQAAGQWAVFVL